MTKYIYHFVLSLLEKIFERAYEINKKDQAQCPDLCFELKSRAGAALFLKIRGPYAI